MTKKNNTIAMNNTAANSSSSEGAGPSETTMEKLLRLMETQQQQLQAQMQAQFAVQQKQMDALTRVVGTLTANVNANEAIGTAEEKDEVQEEVQP